MLTNSLKSKRDKLKLHSAAFEMLNKIEQNYNTDSIITGDGTKIWNLIRIIIFYYFQKQDNHRIDSSSSKNRYQLSLEIFKSIKTSSIDFIGFSSTESRRLFNEVYYDIYLDPLYEVLGDNYRIYEWPSESGQRRKYDKKIFSRQFVPLNVPIFSSAFWNIFKYKFLFKKNLVIFGKDVLDDIIKNIINSYELDRIHFTKNIYDSIIVFISVKKFIYRLLTKIRPKAVFIKCGYGRFHMGLSQACKELKIPSIELQHGFINKYTPGYVKNNKSKNIDCIPEYFLAYGEKFSEIVRNGNLFSYNKVVTIGFPFLEKSKFTEPKYDERLKNFVSRYQRCILITSDSLSHVANSVEKFTMKLSKSIDDKKINCGILFKPHPYDMNNYDNIVKNQNIFLTDKFTNIYDLFKTSSIHSTVFSTSAIESLAFGIPNIFIYVKGNFSENIQDLLDEKSCQLARNIEEYVIKLEKIINNYVEYSKNAKQKSELYFKSNAIQNFKNFVKNIEILI
ncbi:MAG: hypothetical protein JXA91_01250 [Candidatus Thermoplasmatota archaeon]|nr:hypothetical protein [Candidatus Thermoplasmatota archaeon]